MNLKLRLNLIITGLLALVMMLGAVFLVRNAREDVQAEVQSTTVLALHLLDAEIMHYASDYDWLNPANQDPATVFRLKSLDNVRHLRIEFFDMQGRLRESNHADNADQRENAPSWFMNLINLVSPTMKPTHRPIMINNRPLGELVVTPDPSYEIAEMWNDILSLMGLVAFFFVVVNVMVYWAVGRALNPVGQVLSALAELEKGNWSARLPNFNLRELSSISSKFNAMASTLQASVQKNHKLTQQIITLQEEERKHLARELHDEIGQHLTAIHVDAAAILKAKTLNEAATSATAIGHVSRQMMEIVRDMLQQLRPAVLEELGLDAALHELIESWQQRHPNVRVTISITGHLGKLPEVTAIAAYRMVQECLTNISRHAAAANVTVDVLRTQEHLIMHVEDDGRGFDLNQSVTGFGLAGMRERIEGLHGAFGLISEPGKGVAVNVHLPLTGGEG